MKKTVYELVKGFKESSDCTIEESRGLPFLGSELFLPKDLKTFYESCAGGVLYASSPLGVSISGPESLQIGQFRPIGRNNQNDITASCGAIAKGKDHLVLIDLSKERLGRCYLRSLTSDNVPGPCFIVATSFTELLASIDRVSGVKWKTLSDNGAGLGDAFDQSKIHPYEDSPLKILANDIFLHHLAELRPKNPPAQKPL